MKTSRNTITQFAISWLIALWVLNVFLAIVDENSIVLPLIGLVASIFIANSNINKRLSEA